MENIEFVCPQTGLVLRRLIGSKVALLNEACRKKRVIGSAGQPIKGPLSALWMRSDNAVCYVERAQIPIFLVEESIIVQDIIDRNMRSELLQ